MNNEQYIESRLSVGSMKYLDANEIFTEEEIDAINNKIPELDERVGIIEKDYAKKTDLNSKAEVSVVNDINSKISNLTDNNPSGVYANLNALKTAKPNGESKVYITSDNGNWNYWNGSEWVSGGSFQSSVREEKHNLNCNIIPSVNGYPNYDSSTGIFDFNSSSGADVVLLYDNTYYVIPPETTITNTQGSTAVKLTFDRNSKAFNFRAFNYVMSDNELLVFTFRRVNGGRNFIPCGTFPIRLNGTFDYLLEGVKLKSNMFPSKIITSDLRTPMGCNVGIFLPYNCTPPDLDTTNKTLTFYNDTIFIYNNEHYSLTENIVVDLNTNTSSAKRIYFDTANKNFSVGAPATKLSENCIVFGTLRLVNDKKYSVYLPCEFTINGKERFATKEEFVTFEETAKQLIENQLPAIYKNEIKEVKNELYNIYDSEKITYAFITDTHMDSESYTEVVKKQVKSLVKLSKTTDLDFIIVGGDLTSGKEFATKELMFERMNEIIEPLSESKVPVFVLPGNHDDYSYSMSPTEVLKENLVTNQEWVARFVKPLVRETIHSSKDKNSKYFFYDIPHKKIRIICLDAIDYPIEIENGYMRYSGHNWWGYSKQQMEWLKDEALKFSEKEGWRIVIATHCPTRVDFQPYNYNTKFGTTCEGIVEAFNNSTTFSDDVLTCDFTGNSNKIVSISFGHTHADLIKKDESLDVYFTSTGCSAPMLKDLSNQNPSQGYTTPTNRTNGINEALYDIFTINNDSIIRNRFGALN